VDRFLIVAPAGRDAEVVRQLLASARIEAVVDSTGDLLLEALRSGRASGAVVTDDALVRIDQANLHAAIENQPPWSDFPFILLIRRGLAREGSKAIEALINSTVLERPLHPASLISAARAAVRARQRQRLAAEYLEEREQAERQLRELASTLEQKVLERTRDLASANDRLTAEIAERERAEARLIQAQKMEAIGRLTGGVAHDFNNLLTIIRSATDFLRRRDLPEERRGRYIDAISQTVERASKLTAQLLAFARRQPLKPEVFNVGAQVESVARLIRPLVGGRIRIEVRIGDPDCFAIADIAQFETALINLAVNGRDAMHDEGELAISVKKVSAIPALRAQSGRTGDFVAISMADTGTGIEPDKLEAIFEPFFTTKEVGKGTGLGLSQAFGFAKQSGGDIAVDSTPGHGATFTIYLPQAAAPAREAPASISGSEPATTGRGYRVLVVEDDDEVGQFSTELLEDLGYAVRRVAHAGAALAILAEDEFAADLVFSDVIMPGMNGVELAGVIRARYPGLPVVLTSGYSNVLAENAHRGFELIQKPYSVESLSRILRKAISEKASAH
jgi:signal transduction histidine kinase